MSNRTPSQRRHITPVISGLAPPALLAAALLGPVTDQAIAQSNPLLPTVTVDPPRSRTAKPRPRPTGQQETRAPA
ncbi:MAG: hypothetical protein WA418_30865, partial [Bradyrhizobium sp.]